MQLRTYLAMTAGELTLSHQLPENVAWMACHFSAYSTGLSNLPHSLPPGSILMVNDRTPIWYHDPALILIQLQQLIGQHQPRAVLLDFQRPECWETEQLTAILVKELTCPVIVSECYAERLDCPVFVSASKLCVPLEKQLLPWNGRSIWLEAVCAEEVLTVTPDGCNRQELSFQQPQDLFYEEERLCCCYDFTVSTQKAVFTLQRQPRHLEGLLTQAEQLGIENAIGFYRQLHKKSSG